MAATAAAAVRTAERARSGGGVTVPVWHAPAVASRRRGARAHTAGVSISLAAVVFLCVAVGGVLQRISGMGVGMVAAPTLSLLVGPVAGVTMSNAAASVSALILFWMLRRHVDWPRFLRLAPLLVVGALAGAWTVRVMDHAWLEASLGATAGAAAVPWWAWAPAVAGAPAGIAVGSRLTQRVDPGRARRVAVTLAGVGAAVTLVRGLASL